MTTYREIFTARHTILPVIHVEGVDQAIRNAEIARQCGADGVFLINHSISHSELLSAVPAVRQRVGAWWIGVNCLDLIPESAFEKIGSDISGLWADNARIDERSECQTAAEQVQAARIKSGWRGLYFGGVAFKYQRPVEDLEAAALLAAGFMDVVTTSGPGTGMSAQPEKIATMKRALGTHPLAIASGITPENVHEYLEVADCFLVATGVSSSFTELDPIRLKKLIQNVRS